MRLSPSLFFCPFVQAVSSVSGSYSSSLHYLRVLARSNVRTRHRHRMPRTLLFCSFHLDSVCHFPFCISAPVTLLLPTRRPRKHAPEGCDCLLVPHHSLPRSTSAQSPPRATEKSDLNGDDDSIRGTPHLISRRRASRHLKQDSSPLHSTLRKTCLNKARPTQLPSPTPGQCHPLPPPHRIHHLHLTLPQQPPPPPQPTRRGAPIASHATAAPSASVATSAAMSTAPCAPTA